MAVNVNTFLLTAIDDLFRCSLNCVFISVVFKFSDAGAFHVSLSHRCILDMKRARRFKNGLLRIL